MESFISINAFIMIANLSGDLMIIHFYAACKNYIKTQIKIYKIIKYIKTLNTESFKRKILTIISMNQKP